MYLSTLCEWLAWISSIHTTEIDLGLERVKIVASRLKVLNPTCSVIIVGGTNGKGSTVAGLESIYRAAGYHVGAFTSPVLFKHNEYVRIDGQLASDEAFCDAYAKIEAARNEITLTPFEYHALAALLIFKKEKLDVLILEVGLGGRLDAVNIIDADVSVVTSISIDHVDWLGSTREAIGREKAGIFRSGRPAVYGELDPPHRLTEYAHEMSTPLYCQQKEFTYTEEKTSWSWGSGDIEYTGLPVNILATQNMATVLMAVTLLQEKLPVTYAEIVKGLTEVKLIGRIQLLDGPVMQIFDVSHNPAAVGFLASRLKNIPCRGRTHAVFSMLADKDIDGSIQKIRDMVDEWYVAALSVQRAANEDRLRKAFRLAEINRVSFYPSIEDAYKIARQTALPGDRIIIFGSFHTIAGVWNV